MKRIKFVSFILAALLVFCATPYVFATDPCATHSFGEWAVTVEPDCTSKGVKERTCTVCGFVEQADVPAKGHNTLIETVQATCTENGYTRLYCPVCGYEYSNTVIPSAGHTSGTRKVITEATSKSSGETATYCTVCGELVRNGVYTLNDPYVSYSVSSPEEYDSSHNSVDVTVSLKNNPGVWGMSFYLYFDPAFTFVSSSCGNVFASENVMISSQAVNVASSSWARSVFKTSGVEIGSRMAVCFYADTSDFSDNTANGTLMTLKFIYDASLEGTFDFGFAYDPGSVIDSSGDDVDILFVDGKYTVEEVANILYGDVNGDGRLNSRDLSQMKKYISGIITDDAINYKNSDINGDNRINSKDISALKKLFTQ